MNSYNSYKKINKTGSMITSKNIHLDDNIFKILPMKEENSLTLKSYLESYQRELIGNKELVDVLVDEPQFITVLNIIQFLISEEYTNEVCKKEVFKCIRILQKIKNKYFCEVSDNG